MITVGEIKKAIAGLPDSAAVKFECYAAPADDLEVEFENVFAEDDQLYIQGRITNDLDREEDEEDNDACSV